MNTPALPSVACDMARAVALTRTHAVFVAYAADGAPIGYGFDRRFASRITGADYVRKLPSNAWRRKRKAGA